MDRSVSPLGGQRLGILLRLLLLILTQQTIPLASGMVNTAAMAMLQVSTAAVGFLLAPQAVQAQGPTVALSIADATEEESAGTMSFTVTATPAPTSEITFKYTVTQGLLGTASEGVDFVAVRTATTATIAANATSTTIMVSLLDDFLLEASEAFTVTLSEPSAGVTLSDATAIGTITSNDKIPEKPTSLSITPVENSITLNWTAATNAAINKWQFRFKNKERSWRGWYPFDVKGSTASTRSTTLDKTTTLHGGVGQYQVRAAIRDSNGEDQYGPWSDTAAVSIINTDNLAVEFGGSDVTATGSTSVTYNASVAQGDSISYTVKLSDAALPYIDRHPVQVTLTSNDKVRVTPSSLTFNRANAQTAQTMTVTGVASGSASIDHAVRFPALALLDPAGTVSVTVIGTVPAQPTGFSATAGDGWVRLSWTDPKDSRITGWQYQQKTGTGAYSDWIPIGGSGPSTMSHTVGLSKGIAYQFKIRAVSNAGAGEESGESSSVTPRTVVSFTKAYQYNTPSGTDCPSGIEAISVDEVKEGGTLVVEVSRSRSSRGVQTLPIEFEVGTKMGATGSAADLSVSLTTLNSMTFDAGVTRRCYYIGVAKDLLVEPNEQLVLRIKAKSDYIVSSTAGERTITIQDYREQGIRMAWREDAALQAGVSGSDSAEVTLYAGAPTGSQASNYVYISTNCAWTTDTSFNKSVTIPWQTSRDKAAVLADFDYPDSVTFTNGVATVTFEAKVDGDTANEDFGLEISPVIADEGLNKLLCETQATATANSLRRFFFFEGSIAPAEKTVTMPQRLSVAESTDHAVVTVTTTQAFGESVTFNVTYSGTATGANNPANGDYDNDAVTSITFNSTDTTKDIRIPITDDSVDDDDETIIVTIALAPDNTLPDGFTLHRTSTTVTITDNDDSTVSVLSTLSVAENAGNAVVTVTATKPFGPGSSSATFDITYSGTATGANDPANGDYDNDAVTSVTFNETDTTKNITIPITDDNVDEGDETIIVTIALAPGNVLPEEFLLGNTTTTVTITDDDESPELDTIADQPIKLGQAVDVTAVATDGDPGDTISYTWTRKAGETIPAIPENTEQSAARLNFTPAAIGTYTMTVTASDGTNSDTEEVVITVNPAATVSVPTPLSFPEGTNSNSNATVTITTTDAFNESVTFNVTYGDTGTATGAVILSEGDYDNDAVTSVTFNTTDTSKDIAIPLNSDKEDENDETIKVNIAVSGGSLPDGYVFGNAATTVTIQDDDSSPVLTPIENETIKLGQAVDITAVATDADTGDTISYTWTRDTSETTPAIPGNTELNAARLNFTPPAIGTYTMTVTASDSTNEDAEQVVITVSNQEVVSVPATLPPVTEGTDGNVTVTITTTGAFGQDTVFNVTYGGTATGANSPSGTDDYDNDAVTSVTFNATDTSKDIVIPLYNDKEDEDDKTITVTIAPATPPLPAGFVLGNTATTVTIQDNDSSPVLTTIADRTIKLGQSVDITAVATDEDGDTLSYTWTRDASETTPAIPGNTELNAARLNFTPPAIGTYTMTVTASDGTNGDTEQVMITVNQAATVSVLSTLAATEGTNGNAIVTITTTAAFGQDTVFNVTYGGTATGANSPSGTDDYDNDAVTSITFNATDTSKDIVIPLYNDKEDEDDKTITVTITPATPPLPEGFVLGNTTTTVTIQDDDSSPVLTTIEDQTIKLGQEVDITAVATDADGDTVSYTWTRDRSETTPAIPENTEQSAARLNFTPPAIGTYTMMVTASDGTNEDTEPVVITVVNEDIVSVPSTLAVTEGTDGNATVTITTTAAFGQDTVFNVTYGGTATGANSPSGTDDYDNDAVTSVAFNATDTSKDIVIPLYNDKEDEDDKTITVSIAPAAALPAGFVLPNTTTRVTITDNDSSPMLMLIEDQTIKLGQEVDITASATDADGDTVSYTWTRDTSETTPAIPGNTELNAARLNFTPPAVGTYTMTVTASDGTNEDTESVMITVNQAATVSVPAELGVVEDVAGNVATAEVTITASQPFAVSITFNIGYSDATATGAGNPADGDYDNDAVTTVTFSTTDITKTISIPITPDRLDEDDDETFTVSIAPATALPAGFVLSNATTRVTIADNDSSPMLTLIEDQTIKLGQEVDITASATDADGDTVSYTWTRDTSETTPAIPGNTELNAARLNFTPPAVGTYTMTVTASDGTNEDTESVMITVNQAATVSVPAELGVVEDVAGNVATAEVTITASQPFAVSITFNIGYSDATATGAGNPADGDYDNDAVTTVTFSTTDITKTISIPITPDRLDEDDDETFTVSIAPATALPAGFVLSNATTRVTIADNDSSPMLTLIEDQTIKLGQEVDITASATDADGDTVSYTWMRDTSETTPAIPGNTELDAARLNFTPPAVGTYTMTVTASDGTNEDTEPVMITVNQAATVSVPAELGVVEDVAGNVATAEVTITASQPFAVSTTFNIGYSDATATGAGNPADGDYDNDAVTTVTFSTTDITKTISIPITPDRLDEDDDETFTVSIAPATALPAGFVLSNATTRVTIADNDSSPMLTLIEDQTIKLGQEVDITASATDADGDTVSYTWMRDTSETTPAIPGNTELDAARLNFTPPAIGTYTMTVTASDGTNEDTEPVVITVNQAATVSVPAELGVVEDVAGNVATAEVTITASQPFAVSITFNIGYSDATATGAGNPADGDYDNDAVTTVTFSTTDITKTISIPITPDRLDEDDDETFTVSIAPATALPAGFVLSNATTRVTIADNDSSPMLTLIEDQTIKLGQEVDITASATDADGDTVSYTWMRDTSETTPAIPGNTELDAARLNFTPPAIGTYTMTVTASDGTNEDTEPVVITVNQAATVSVPAELGVVEDVAGNVATAEVTITASQPFAVSITFNIGYSDATATGAGNPADGDYDNDAVTTISFSTTDTTKIISIPITPDRLDEDDDETFTVSIAPATALPAGFVLGNATTTVTITDNDLPTPPTLDKARKAALAAFSGATLSSATDVISSRISEDCPVATDRSMGDQALGIVDNILGLNGNELPTNLSLDEIGEQLWDQSFQISPPPISDSRAQQDGMPPHRQQRCTWTLWGEGELASYRGDTDDADQLSFSGHVKTAWLGIDHQFVEPWLAGVALSFSSGDSGYSYQTRDTDGVSNHGETMATQLTTVYPYGSVQLNEQFRLWGMLGLGFGSQHHQQQQSDGDNGTVEGEIRLRMGVIGFEQELSSIGASDFALAGDLGVAKTTTHWTTDSGLQDLSVQLSRVRLGVDSSFPIFGSITGHLGMKGRFDEGDSTAGAGAELVAGLQYIADRFSSSLQGRQVYAFDGSYAESGISAQLRFSSRTDGTGLAWYMQPSYGSPGHGALAGEPSLWTDEQLESLAASRSSHQQEGMEFSSRLGYGIRLHNSALLLTPFTEVRLDGGSSRLHRAGLNLEGVLWEVTLTGSREDSGNSSETEKLELIFSRQL